MEAIFPVYRETLCIDPETGRRVTKTVVRERWYLPSVHIQPGAQFIQDPNMEALVSRYLVMEMPKVKPIQTD